ncbi:alpha/beta hydrolase family protein [Paenibacillus azoreducens]|uniref:Alpha/beta fold hydrolase n=1 Tax=Paenibacillus azoreducens TaxID=116718 RepID=A0A920CUY9_9BACL|nr:stalk domain-containing protein [Paenibacillus azoreducens]GIO49903.1 hypothetical protein J34TS1_46680 [Paenibacillus azoreducens]
MKKKNSQKFYKAAIASMVLALSVPAVAAAADSGKESSYAPVREVAAKLGANVKWDQAALTITLTKGDDKLLLFKGMSHGMFNGKRVELGSQVRVNDGKATVPSSAIINIFEKNETENNGSAPAAPNQTADLFLKELQAGNGAKAAEYMSPALAKALPVQTLSMLWSNYEQVYGKAAPGNPVKTEQKNAIHQNVTYTVQTSQTPLNVTLRLNADGLVDDMNLSPSPVNTGGFQKPAYDNPAAYTEQEVRVGTGDLALPGTLTLPKGDGPFPAVVLVQGSGMHDRDSSSGAVKPMRDLAVGLAAKGIAVLRYDKITYEHTFKVAADPKFTLKRETVDDALSAVNLLKQTPKIDASRIFIAGHSQGGFAIPLMIDADKAHDIAGAISLSGPSSKFADVLIEQQQELIDRVKKLGQDAAPYEQQAAVWTGIAKLVNDPQYTVDHMPEKFPLSPAYWWFEQKNYKPTDLAQKQHTPMLILQGENDWQVTMKQFNEWKSALQKRSDVEFKSYPKMNHLLVDYDGISIGAEYAKPANVSSKLITDIASWIQKQK